MRAMPAPLEHMQDSIFSNGGGNRLAALLTPGGTAPRSQAAGASREAARGGSRQRQPAVCFSSACVI